VEATDLTYGWSSKKLADLGGSERARLPGMFDADYEWSQKGKIQVPATLVVFLSFSVLF
jgi:hypothetical protein